LLGLRRCRPGKLVEMEILYHGCARLTPLGVTRIGWRPSTASNCKGGTTGTADRSFHIAADSYRARI
jgi:hypothetical protein